MKNFKIGDKITRVPLIQGGMGVGISLGRLAGSVAKAGGVGIISTAQIGYREEDFDRNPAAANERAIAGEMKKARMISEDGIIGYNIMVAHRIYRQIRKSNPEILGQKIQKNCRSGSDRRSSGGRTPWLS